MPIYQTSGTLVDAIPAESVQTARDYLRQDDMTVYLDEPLLSAVERVQWDLAADGYHWTVEAVTRRELTEEELEQLAGWTSGQNSDGLGEGFEQQDWAWVGEEVDIYGDVREEGHMASFDWETNKCKFVRVA